MSIYENWTPREIAALKRATAKLRATQPKPQQQYPSHAKSGHRGITWDASKGKFRVFLRTEKGRAYCGTADTIEDALAIQAHHKNRA